MSLAKKGKKLSEEHKAALSKSKSGKMPGNLKMLHSDKNIINKRKQTFLNNNNVPWNKIGVK